VCRSHGLAVTSLLAGLLGVVLVVLVLPASATPVPAGYLALYRQAARTCPGLSWEVLAGIGTVESDNGQSRARGVHRGKNRKGAEGPMQFEPATFAEYAVRADPAARLTPYDPADAIFTTARMLCANGVARGPAGLRRAIFDYNHACWYVGDVLTLATRYAGAKKTRPARARTRASRKARRSRKSRRPRRPRRPHRPGGARQPREQRGPCANHRHSRGYDRSHGGRAAKSPPARRRRGAGPRVMKRG
jgi:hypothetical protein